MGKGAYISASIKCFICYDVCNIHRDMAILVSTVDCREAAVSCTFWPIGEYAIIWTGAATNQNAGLGEYTMARYNKYIYIYTSQRTYTLMAGNQ